MQETVIVTGGAGFIGSHIVDELVKQNYSVKVIDDFSFGKEEFLAHHKDAIKVVRGNILDLGLLQKEFKKGDFVLHLAALRSVGESVKHPKSYNDVNINGTLNVLTAARDNEIRRMVLASSSSVYGDSERFPSVETLEPKPVSPYALSKLCQEHYSRIFFKLFGLSAVNLRYFNVFGPRQSSEGSYAGVISKFARDALTEKPSTILGDGLQSRDFTFVSDVVQANLAAMRSNKGAGEVFNVSAGKSISILHVHSLIQKLLKKKIFPIFAASRPGDVRKSQGDPQKAKETFGFACRVPFEEGLARTVDWFQKQDLGRTR